MTNLTNFEVLMSIAGVIITFGGAWITVKKIANYNKKDKEDEADDILQAAKEEAALKQKDLELRVLAVENRMTALERSTEKDLTHIKETYTSEIHNLAEKIEDLRKQLSEQHLGVLNLLTKLINHD